jgi:hypothetical protein
MKKQKLMTRFYPEKIWVAMAACVLLLSACDKEKEPIPGYLNFQPFTVQSTDPSVHGSVSSKITHARISLLDPVDSTTQLIGLFELPATMPVLAEGQKTAFVDPIIKANGNSFYLDAYPFYERFYGTVQVVPGEETEVKPTTTYKDEAKFVLIEDFEGGSHLFENDQDDNDSTSLEASASDVFEGEKSGKIVLDSTNFLAVVASNDFYTIDYSKAARVYLEVNYKTDVPMDFGLMAVDNVSGLVPNFEFHVFAKDEWNKIYFDMTDLVRTASPVDKFYIVFRAFIPFENGKPTLDHAEVYVDNIKLIHF